MKAKLLILLLFCSPSLFSLGGKPNKVDSLITVLHSGSEPDKEFYLELGSLIGPKRADTVISLMDEKLLSEIPTNLKAYVHYVKGIAEKRAGDMEKSILELKRGIINLPPYDYQGHYILNIEVGRSHMRISDYEEALNYYFAALEYQKRLGNDIPVNDELYKGIANCYRRMGDAETAIKWLDRGYQKFLKAEDESILYSFDHLYALIYQGSGDYEKSDSVYRKLISRSKLKGRRLTYINNLGTNFMEQGELDSAFYYFSMVYEERDSLKDPLWKMIAKINLGCVSARLGKPGYGIKLLHEGLERASRQKILIRQLQACKCLHIAYSKKGNYARAYEYQAQFHMYRDSMRNDEKLSNAIRMDKDMEIRTNRLRDSLEAAMVLQETKSESERVLEQQQIYTYAGIIGFVLMLALALLGYRAYTIKRKSTEELTTLNREISEQKNLVDEKNHEILSSINYAKRIQAAILPPDDMVQKYLPSSFIFYLPKDIVAGDFYWMHQDENTTHFAVADCTGHGVPGAMVSVVCNNALNRSVREYQLTEPGEVLNKTREIVIQEFEKSKEDVNDGMDIALCSLSRSPSASGKYLLKYSGAHNPLWIIRDGELIEFKGQSQPIGNYLRPEPFKSIEMELHAGDMLYIFSDGFPDQFGGPKMKKYKYSNFKKFLAQIHEEHLSEQSKLLAGELNSWKGSGEQIDDVCVMGVKIPEASEL